MPSQPTSRIDTGRVDQGTAKPNTRSPGPRAVKTLSIARLLVALLGAIAMSAALWQLFGARAGLDVSHRAVDGIPISVFADRLAEPAPVVVIGHGFAGSRQLMLPFATTLARNGYTAVVFDFPGHGDNRTLLAGEIGEEERTRALLDAFARVVEEARALPGGDGRLATLGHSMAGDILVRYALEHDGSTAAVAVSPYLSKDPEADRPRNLLLIYGALEPPIVEAQGREAVALAAGAPPEKIETGKTYGDMADGTARRLVIAEGVEHIGVLYSETSLRAAVDWLDQAFARPAKDSGVDRRGPWLGLYFLGVMLLAWSLSALLPRAAEFPLGAGLGWRRLLPVAVLPAILTPLILWPLPTDFMSIVIGDYIALHFGLYGILVIAGLLRIGERPGSLLRGTYFAAAALAVTAVILFQTLALTLPVDRFVASYLPGAQRLPTVMALFVGTLIWFVADEWLTRGEGAARGGYPFTKFLFLVSLALAVALNLNELFFLVIIIPAILALFIVYGLFSRWIYRSTNQPIIAALANALAFATAIAVSFPLVA